jgi:Protein kinase domain
VAFPAAVPSTPSRLSPAILDAAADPDAVRTHPVTLKFASPELEAAFKEQYQYESLRHTRLAFALGVVLVAMFGILDAVILPSVRNQLWTIRFGFICPVLLVLMVATLAPGVVRYIEWILSAGLLVTGAGILALVLISPPGHRYYDPGLILVLMYTYVFVKLRFAVATLVGWTLVALYFVVELRDTPWPLLTNNLFFWVSASVIGMGTAYFLESLARRNFVQEKLVRRVREFGSYRLVAPLGEGGMGEVWRAEHRLLARPAAIKLIRPEQLGATDPEGRRATLRRFEREAQATALLRSPHTIQLYDFGVSDVGVFYYVMELLDGFNLDTLVRRFGPLPWARVVHLLVQVCDSLAEAHEQGLIHCDIKPANIYVCRYGRTNDFVKVLDFGLVKSEREREPIHTTATGHGQFLGTPSCMAPEQIDPDGLVDARTDIYGVGCVAYWLLTGTDVFCAPSALQVMAHHLHTLPTAPSACTDHPIPAALDRVVLACLEKNPQDRPQTADALARELTACGTDEIWSPDLAQSWWSAHAVTAIAEPWSGEERMVMPSLAGPWRG